MKTQTKGKLGMALAIAAIGGFAATVWLTAKKAPEAKAALEAALEKKREETGNPEIELTLTEKIKAQAAIYAPVAGAAMLTAAGIAGSQILPQGTIQDLTKLHDTYRETVKKLNGPQAEKLVSQITDEEVKTGHFHMLETFALPYNGEWLKFDSTLPDVFECEYNVNRFFTGTGEITFDELLQCFHLDKIIKVEGGDRKGWNSYLGEAFYGYSWIDFCHRRGMLDGKPITYIDMPFECHHLTEEEVEEDIQKTVDSMMLYGKDGEERS